MFTSTHYFMYFWLNYCDENHHIERIPVAVQNIDNLFRESLENGTELIVCTEEQIQKLLIYFELKRYLSLKNISYPLNTDYFL